MPIIEIHPEPISGPWVEGFVLDKHVLTSTPIGYLGEHMQFDTIRTALGERVYQFKNKNGSPEDIVDTAVNFISTRWPSQIDSVISPPPSVSRRHQPAVILSSLVGKSLGLKALGGVVKKKKATRQMKNVPLHERHALLKEAIRPGEVSVQGMSVLIIDDLWETGGTMRRTAEVVNEMGAKEIRVLAMTRTK